MRVRVAAGGHDAPSGEVAPRYERSLDNLERAIARLPRVLIYDNSSDKRGRLSPRLRSMLERLDLDIEAWVNNVARYGGLFHGMADKVHRLRELARSIRRVSFHGHRGARQL